MRRPDTANGWETPSGSLVMMRSVPMLLPAPASASLSRDR